MLINKFTSLDNDEIDILYEFYYSVFISQTVNDSSKHYSSRILSNLFNMEDKRKFLICLKALANSPIDKDKGISIDFLGVVNNNEFMFKVSQNFIFAKENKIYTPFSKTSLDTLFTIKDKQEKVLYIYLTTRLKRRIGISYNMFLTKFGFDKDILHVESIINLNKKLLLFVYKYFEVKGFSFVYNNDKLQYFNITIDGEKHINQ